MGVYLSGFSKGNFDDGHHDERKHNFAPLEDYTKEHKHVGTQILIFLYFFHDQVNRCSLININIWLINTVSNNYQPIPGARVAKCGSHPLPPGKA